MHTLMIPASCHTYSGGVGAIPKGSFSTQFHALHALNAPHASAPSPVRFAAQQTTHLRRQSSPLNNPKLRSRRGGSIYERRGLFSSPFSPNYGATSSILHVHVLAAAAADDSSQAQLPQTPSVSQKSRVLSSLSELQEKLQENIEEELSDTDEEDSDGEDDDGRLKKQTTIVSSEESVEGEEGEVESIVHEYKLTEDGTLSSVTVYSGDDDTGTKLSKLDMIRAEVGTQARLLLDTIRNFSLRKFIRDWGKKEPGLEDLKFNASMYAPIEGISNITQWTATELTLQRASMVRIARDTLYLVCAFTLFGVVRILEAVAAVFATSPPTYSKIFDAFNALDPLTIASLASAMRQPVVGMLDVDPTNLEEVHSLKAKFWSELHKFYERQWKVMATLGFARLLTLIVTHLPSAEWVTSKLKVVWDISMALPIF